MTTKASDDLALIMAVREASRAITCLYLAAEESVVNDVRAKVEEAFKAYQLALAARERAVWLEAAEMIEQYKTTDGSSSPGQATVRHLVTKCRQQAEAVR